MMYEKMTTEQFHQLLLENTTRHADERKRHQNELARLRTEYNVSIDEIASMEDEAQALSYGKAQEANLWTLNNNIIQSNRHNIFERYRLSGALPGDTGELLHPGWTKREKGVSDEDD